MSDEVYEPQETGSLTDNNGPAMLGQPFWSANPVEIGATTSLSVPIEYTVSAVIAGEYIGNNDPGQGKGTPLEVKDDHLVITMVVDQATGSHPINIRAQDNEGTWSSLEPTILTVMDTPIAIPPSENV